MPNTKDMAENPYPSILLIGGNGTHKTHFIGTCPKPLLFDFDGTRVVLRGKDIDYFMFKDAPKDSKVHDPAKGIYPWGTAYPAFLKKLNEIGATIEAQPYKTIGMDSLTSFGRIVLNYAIKESGYTVDARHPVDQGLWGYQWMIMQTAIEQLNSWPVIKVLTAHIQRDTNIVTNNIEQLPLTTGKFAGIVPTLFDEVYYCERSGTGFDCVARTVQTGMFMCAKTPLGVPDKTPLEWKEIEKYVIPKGAGKAA